MRRVVRIRRVALITYCAAALLAGCAPVGSDVADGDSLEDAATLTTQVAIEDAEPEASTPSAPPSLEQPLEPRDFPATCDDVDGDGFGVNCTNGPDCDDGDPNVTNGCYRCAHPATGCPCDTPGARQGCDALTDSDQQGPDGSCHPGERICENGTWTRCIALDGSSRTITPPSPCGTVCNPDCRVSTVCPTDPSDLSSSSGVVIGTSPPPAFCPPGTGPGGVRLPGGSPGGSIGGGPCPGGTGTCGGTCCAAGQTCWTYEDTRVIPSWCTAGGRVPPPPVRNSYCGLTCRAGETHCGVPPNDDCCSGAERCHRGACRVPGGRCNRSADCPVGYYCDLTFNECFPTTGGPCNCDRSDQQQGCLASFTAQGGSLVNDIFTTPSGQDARSLRFARYVRGIETAPSGCRIGVSSSSTGLCPTCTPTICTAYRCVGSPTDFATISQYANALDWRWTQHVRSNDSGGAVADGDSRFYYPWRARIYDLGAPANRVVLFPITDHTSDSCLEPFEYSVWLTDNPNATTIANPMRPDPNQWNAATLTQIFTQGWTRNPRAIGSPTDTNDLRSTAYGDAVADAMTSVWALPCGYSFRYAAISAGNYGNPTGSCAFHSADDELDAVAGLNAEGNPLSIYHVLPYGSSAGPDGLSFSTQVRTADVYFLFDTTGSMGGELANLRASLTTGTFVTGCPGGITAGIRCIIPDAWFGVGYFDDFPVTPYGSPGWDDVYRHVLDMTSSVTSAQIAINSLTIHNGYDGPESHVPALFSIATGRGYPGFLSDRGACAIAGGIGYPCFRPGTIPIVMMFTDAMFHNGPGDTYLYNDSSIFGSGGSITYPPAVTVSGNDTQASAYVLSETSSFVARGTTSGMANNFTPSCAWSSAPDVVFRVTLTATRNVHFDTMGSFYDTILAVVRSDGVVMGCNDDSSGTLQSSLDLTLGPGTYYVWVDGYGSSAGSYTFRYGVRTTSTTARTPRFAETVDALNAIGAKVIVVQSCGGQWWCSPDGRNHAVALANGTGSIVSGGAPAVYNIAADGSGLGSAVVNAVSDLANYSRMDVTTVALDNPATPSVDERCFVRNPAGTPPGTVRLSNPAIGETAPYAAGRCIDPPGSVGGVPVVARQCLPGSTVNFRAEFTNNCVMSTSVDQTFTFDLVTYGNGTYELGRTPVTIVVPRAAYPASGTFSYDVDATTACGAGRQVDWTQLQFVANTPSGTSIDVDVRTATTSAGLATATDVRLGTVPPATSPLDIGTALLARGISNRLPYLRVTFTLRSNATRDATPDLAGYRVLFNCIDGT